MHPKYYPGNISMTFPKLYRGCYFSMTFQGPRNCNFHNFSRCTNPDKINTLFNESSFNESLFVTETCLILGCGVVMTTK